MVTFCGKTILPGELHYRLLSKEHWESRTWTMQLLKSLTIKIAQEINSTESLEKRDILLDLGYCVLIVILGEE